MNLLDRKKEFDRIWKQTGSFLPRNSVFLVTGANGLIASNFVDALIYFNWTYGLQNKIIALCRNGEKAKKRFAEYLNDDYFSVSVQDVQNFSLQEHCDYILHAASNAHPLAYSTHPVDTMKTNLIGTIRLLEYASETKVKKFLYISTSEIYGDIDGISGKYEESCLGSVDTLNPRSCYSESKRCAETLCVCYGKEKNLDVSFARPGYIYGGEITCDNSRADAQFLRRVIENQDIIMKSRGEQVRSYCYVADAVCALFFIMLKGRRGEAYNIANSSSEVSVREFADTMAKIGKVKIVFDLPSDVEKQGYSVIKHSVLSDRKLKDLGWRPEYDLQRGLEDTIRNAK